MALFGFEYDKGFDIDALKQKKKMFCILSLFMWDSHISLLLSLLLNLGCVELFLFFSSSSVLS